MVDTETNFELTIEKLVYGGDGLGRADGRVVLVPQVLPGERVLVAPVLRTLRRLPLSARQFRAATRSQALDPARDVATRGQG